MTQTYIGVDLSKDWLDICHPETGHSRVENTPEAVRTWLGGLAQSDVPVFEATSGCDGLLMRCAAEQNHPMCRINPLHAWHFAQSLNLPKTDRVDAAMLARMGRERQLAPGTSVSPERAQLTELSRRREQLKCMETQEKNRLSKTDSRPVRADIKAVLKMLTRRIARIQSQIDAFVADRPDIRRDVALLETIPGIGRVTSVTLVCAMPELGQCDRRAIASLGGLAPKARESGKWRGNRRIGAGRRHVRRVLYLAALSNLRHQNLAPHTVQRLREKGKAGKIIAIALARKILTIANAVIRTQTPYHPPL